MGSIAVDGVDDGFDACPTIVYVALELVGQFLPVGIDVILASGDVLELGVVCIVAFELQRQEVGPELRDVACAMAFCIINNSSPLTISRRKPEGVHLGAFLVVDDAEGATPRSKYSSKITQIICLFVFHVLVVPLQSQSSCNSEQRLQPSIARASSAPRSSCIFLANRHSR